MNKGSHGLKVAPGCVPWVVDDGAVEKSTLGEGEFLTIDCFAKRELRLYCRDPLRCAASPLLMSSGMAAPAFPPHAELSTFSK